MARHYLFVNCPVMVPMTRSAGDTRKYDGVCCSRLWNALPSSTLAIVPCNEGRRQTGSSTVAEHANTDYARADAATAFIFVFWNRP